MGTAYKVNQAVYKASVFEDIDLSTPDLANITFNDSLSVESSKIATTQSDEPTTVNEAKSAPDNIA